MRWWHLPVLAVVLALALGVYGWREARRDPVVRRADIALPDWPAGAPPISVALFSDIHAESWTMDAGRLARIVAQVNALHPDLVIIAGDTINGMGEAEVARALPALSALGGLKAPLGVVGVLGNHDYWTDPVATRQALAAQGVTMLANDAVARGPLAIGGLDDQPTRHARLGKTVTAMAGLPGARILVAHSPDIGPDMPDDVALLLAGHTHCGQVVLPWIGPVTHVSRYRARYLCGLVREGRRTVIVGAGLGTSVLPVRFLAPPDLWLIRLGPPRR